MFPGRPIFQRSDQRVLPGFDAEAGFKMHFSGTGFVEHERGGVGDGREAVDLPGLLKGLQGGHVLRQEGILSGSPQAEVCPEHLARLQDQGTFDR